MLSDGWPATLLRPAAGRALTLALTAVTALALNRALAAYADSVHWTTATLGDWITTAALSFAGAGIILHIGIGLRWPFSQTTNQDPCATPKTTAMRSDAAPAMALLMTGRGIPPSQRQMDGLSSHTLTWVHLRRPTITCSPGITRSALISPGIAFQGERLEIFPGELLAGERRTMSSRRAARWPA
jgi:hypothetical protein